MNFNKEQQKFLTVFLNNKIDLLTKKLTSFNKNTPAINVLDEAVFKNTISKLLTIKEEVESVTESKPHIEQLLEKSKYFYKQRQDRLV